MTPEMFAISDGTGLSLDQNNATGSDFVLSTDSNGNILGWYVYAVVCTANCGAANYAEDFIETSSTLGIDISMINLINGQTTYALCGSAPFCQSLNAGNNFGYEGGNPGVWSGKTSVPEPGSLLILATGLLALLGLRLMMRDKSPA
jgi:hypothetical protein